MIRMAMAGVMLAIAAWQLGQGSMIQVKAAAGQWLLERSWVRSLSTGSPVTPWPGAVSYPVAGLAVPRLGLRHLVLDSAETPVLAWGPGMEVGILGHRVIAGHRDTHFSFLGDLEPGDRIELALADGTIEHWRVAGIEVVDSRVTAIDMGRPGPLLTLITCYPLDALSPGGPMRLVVSLNRLVSRESAPT